MGALHRRGGQGHGVTLIRSCPEGGVASATVSCQPDRQGNDSDRAGTSWLDQCRISHRVRGPSLEGVKRQSESGPLALVIHRTRSHAESEGTVMMMSLIKHETAKGELTPRRMDRLDRFFDDWPEMFHWPALVWSDRGFDSMRIEEFTEDGSLVLRVEMPGIDPDKDVEISLQGDMLHLSAERRLEEESTGRDYVRQEMRYGSFERDIPLPKGARSTVHATYKNGILEVRVPLMISEEEAPKKIPITTS